MAAWADSDDETYQAALKGYARTLSAIDKSATKWLNYDASYLPDWDEREGFREIYQNWRDGILQSFELSLPDFRPTLTEHSTHVLIEAKHLRSGELMGVIRFDHDKTGHCSRNGLRITNFNAKLKLSHLGIGSTDKAYDLNQTGQHGEGLKLAALIFCRKEYGYVMESSGFKWNFKLIKGGELHCKLARYHVDKIAKIQNNPKHQVCLRRPVIDTSVIIDPPNKSGRLNKITFMDWLDPIFDLKDPAGIIRTTHGDILTSSTDRGHFYLHGLRLPGGGHGRKGYGYGYNFRAGHTSRDRRRLEDPNEEDLNIRKIWVAACKNNLDALNMYAALVFQGTDRLDDAILPQAATSIKMLWTQLRAMNSKDGQSAFYFPELSDNQIRDTKIIQQSLQMHPVPLRRELWQAFRAHSLSQTPQEALRAALDASPLDEQAKSSFGKHVRYFLNSLLGPIDDTMKVKIEFVDAGILDIEANLFPNNVWKIHNKWLAFDTAHDHDSESCDNDRCDGAQAGLFACDHVVLELLDSLIADYAAQYPELSRNEKKLRTMMRNRLVQVPRAIACEAGDRRGQLKVTWDSIEPRQKLGKLVRIVLHSETCTNTDVCSRASCPEIISTAGGEKAVFDNLDPDKKYQPWVSLKDNGLVGLQPDYTRPATTDLCPAPVIPTMSSSWVYGAEANAWSNGEVGDHASHGGASPKDDVHDSETREDGLRPAGAVNSVPTTPGSRAPKREAPARQSLTSSALHSEVHTADQGTDAWINTEVDSEVATVEKYAMGTRVAPYALTLPDLSKRVFYHSTDRPHDVWIARLEDIPRQVPVEDRSDRDRDNATGARGKRKRALRAMVEDGDDDQYYGITPAPNCRA